MCSSILLTIRPFTLLNFPQTSHQLENKFPKVTRHQMYENLKPQKPIAFFRYFFFYFFQRFFLLSFLIFCLDLLRNKSLEKFTHTFYELFFEHFLHSFLQLLFTTKFSPFGEFWRKCSLKKINFTLLYFCRKKWSM